VALAWIPLGNSYRIKIEKVIVALRKPKYRLVSARKSVLGVKAKIKVPDHSIPKFKPSILENFIKMKI